MQKINVSGEEMYCYILVADAKQDLPDELGECPFKGKHERLIKNGQTDELEKDKFNPFAKIALAIAPTPGTEEGFTCYAHVFKGWRRCPNHGYRLVPHSNKIANNIVCGRLQKILNGGYEANGESNPEKTFSFFLGGEYEIVRELRETLDHSYGFLAQLRKAVTHLRENSKLVKS